MKKINFSFPIIILLFFFISSFAFALPVIPLNTTPIIAGSYLTISHEDSCGIDFSQDDRMPLILSMENKNGTWISKKIIDLDKHHDVMIHATSCANQACIIAGAERFNKGKWMPLLLYKHENGWARITNISGIPNIIQDGILYTLNCVNNFCSATGKSWDGKIFFIVSNDNGLSWVVKKYPPLTKVPEGIFSHSCSEQTCVAGGAAKNLPIFMMSKDSGQSWSYIKKITNFPSAFKYLLAGATSCSANNCVVAGCSNTNDAFLVSSQDSGVSWHFEKTILNLPMNVKKIHLHAVSCKNKMCVAGGYLNQAKGEETIFKPLLINSSDGGKTWYYVPSESILGINSEQGEINSVFCSNQVCLAAGAFVVSLNEDKANVIILISHDNGLTWNVAPISNPSHGELRSFDSISCQNQTCIATVSNRLDYDNYSPIAILSSDGGNSWVYSQQFVNLPDNIYNLCSFKVASYGD